MAFHLISFSPHKLTFWTLFNISTLDQQQCNIIIYSKHQNILPVLLVAHAQEQWACGNLQRQKNSSESKDKNNMETKYMLVLLENGLVSCACSGIHKNAIYATILTQSYSTLYGQKFVDIWL